MNILYKLFLLSFCVCLNLDACLSKFAKEEDDLVRVQPTNLQEWANFQVVEVAKESYAQINNNWEYVPVNEKSSTESDYWKCESVEMNGTKCFTVVRSKKKGTYKEALEDLISKPGKLECTIALAAVKLLSTAAILEDKFESFVKWFGDVKAKEFDLKPEEMLYEMSYFCWEESQSNVVKPGAIYYFTNILQYGQIKNGNGRAHNVICVDKDKYVAFSDTCKNGSTTKEMILKELREDFFSKQEIIPGQEKNHENICKILKEPQVYYNMCEKNQKNVPNPFYFDLKIMKDFL